MGLVFTPMPRGILDAMTPLQPTPLGAEDTPDLPLREGLLEPVLCPVFAKLDGGERPGRHCVGHLHCADFYGANAGKSAGSP